MVDCACGCVMVFCCGVVVLCVVAGGGMLCVRSIGLFCWLCVCFSVSLFV